MGIWDFLTADYATRQQRTRDLNDRLGELLSYYLGPTGIPDRLSSANALLNPIGQIGEAGANTVVAFDPTRSPEERRQAAINAGIGTITAAAPAFGAAAIGAPARRGILETLANVTGPADDAATRFIADESGSVPFPPASNSQRTQIAGTFPTYEKAANILDASTPDGRKLDFGAGLGMSRDLGFDTFEPFPREGFSPTYRSASDIPDSSYDKVTNLNVLNVVPREVRDDIVRNIGRILTPNGEAIVTTRGRDVLTAKGVAGPEPMSIVTSANTYQKGFTQKELIDYLSSTLGDGFDVTPVKLGQAGAKIRRLPSPDPVAQRGDEILGLLSSGRANEVTDAMLDLGDPVANTRLNQYLFNNYDLPMDEASRMARAGEMGLLDDQYHATTSDFQAFMPSETGLSGRGVYTGDYPTDIADYATKGGGNQGLNVIPLSTPAGSRYARNIDWQRTLDADTEFPYNATAEETIAGFKRAADTMSQQGYAGVHSQAGERVTFNPSSLRSHFARFDPRLAHLRNLNAALGGLAVGGGLLNQYQDDQLRRRLGLLEN